jgi:hypothetical protein
MSRARYVRPWFLRLVDSSPLGVIGTGVAIVVVWVCVDALLHLWITPVILGIEPMARALYFGCLIGYSICAASWVNRGALEDLDSLRPVFPPSSEGHDAAVDKLRRVPVGTFVCVHVVAALVTLTLGRIGPVSREVVWTENITPGIFFWWIQMAATWLVVLPVLYLGVREVGCFWRIGRRDVDVDLLELEALAPFARFGLRLAGSLLLASAFFVLMLVGLQGAGTNLWFSLLLFVPTWLLALVALIVPSWGVQQAVRDAKQQEVVRVSRAIHGEVDALTHSPIAHAAESLSVVDLLAYRDRTAGLREWPFDGRVLRTFGLYMLIPLLSWVGGALVERSIDWFVGG